MFWPVEDFFLKYTENKFVLLIIEIKMWLLYLRAVNIFNFMMRLRIKTLRKNHP